MNLKQIPFKPFMDPETARLLLPVDFFRFMYYNKEEINIKLTGDKPLVYRW